MTLEKALSLLPLRTSAGREGVKIIGQFNRQNFIEFQNESSNEVDTIKVTVEDPDIDPIGGSALDVAAYHLMPCERLNLMLRQERHELLNRPERPCRMEFPPMIAEMYLKNFTADDLFNAVLAPRLPYDQALCEFTCQARYWLPKCSCYLNYQTYQYAGKRNGTTTCPRIAEGLKFFY